MIAIILKIIAYLFAFIVMALMVYTIAKAVLFLFRKAPETHKNPLPPRVETYLRFYMRQ